MKTFNEAAHKHATAAADLVARKQADYGPKNILNCPAGVEMGIAVRLSDKINRLINLTQTGANPSNESLQDTADDIIGYGLVLKMYLNGEFELPLKKNPLTAVIPKDIPAGEYPIEVNDGNKIELMEVDEEIDNHELFYSQKRGTAYPVQLDGSPGSADDAFLDVPDEPE